MKWLGKWIGIALVLACAVAVYAGKSRKREFSGGPCGERPKIAYGRAGIIRQRSRDWIRFYFVCDIGYHLYGSKFSNCVNGHWTHPFPMCTSNKCERPSVPEGVDVLSLRRSSVLMFRCDDYEKVIEGYKEVFCQDGNWTGPPPRCIHGHLPAKFCPFRQDPCGWSNGDSTSLTWALHPGGYAQTRPDSPIVSVGSGAKWTIVKSLSTTPPPTSTSKPSSTSSPSTSSPSTSSPSTSSPSTSSPSTSSPSTSSPSTSSPSTSSPSPSSTSILSTSTNNVPNRTITSSPPAEPITASTTETIGLVIRRRLGKRSAPVLSSAPPFVRAELVSPEYPSNYSGVCFRLRYLVDGTIPSVFLRVSDSADVYLEAQNLTIHAKHRDWEDSSFEVPAVTRPFQLVIVAEKVGVAVKDVRLEDTECFNDLREEPPTTEPWLETEQTTDPGTTDNWTTDLIDTSEISSTTAKPPSSSSHSVLPTSSVAPSVGSSSTPLKKKKRPSFWTIARNAHLSHRPRIPLPYFHRPLSFPRNSSLVSSIPSSTTRTSVLPTAMNPVNTSTFSTFSTMLSSTISSSKVSKFITKMLSPTSIIPTATTEKTSNSSPAYSRISTLATAATSSTSNPNIAPNTTTTTPTFSSTTSKVPVASTVSISIETLIPSTPEVASTTSSTTVTSTTPSPKPTPVSSTETASTATTHNVNSTTLLQNFSSIPTFSSTESASTNPSSPSSTTPYSSTRTTIHPTFPVTRSSTVTRPSRPWRTASTSLPAETPTTRYWTSGVFRSRSKSTPEQISANRTFKSNQSIEASPGPRFKVRTRYIITNDSSRSTTIRTTANGPSIESSGVTTPTAKLSFITHSEIAMLLIGLVISIGGLFWCLRKRFSCLRSSRIKFGDSYSLQINDADDVGLDILPPSTGRKRTVNGSSVQESSADGEKKRLRRKKCSVTSSLGGFNRLKGTNNYLELVD